MFRNIFIAPKRSSIPTSSHSRTRLWATTHPLSVSVDATARDIAHKRKDTLRGLLRQANFTQHHVFRVNPRSRCQRALPLMR